MKSKNIIAAILITLMTLSVFAGCKKEEVLPTVNEDGVALLKEPVVIADANENYFKIMMPDGNTNVLAGCLSEMISPAKGFRLSYDTAAEQENGNTEKEILVGNTCREESKTAMAAIGYDDFSVTYANNKIIIAAHNPERLAEAVRFFKEKCIRSAEGRLEYIGDYTYMSTDSLMIDRGETLADYKIVIGHDKLYMSAYAIQQYIKEKHGAEPEIIYDSEPKSTNEIVLGNADREIAGSAHGLNLNEGIIEVHGKDLLIATRDSIDTNLLFEIFKKSHLSGVYTDSFNFKSDYKAMVNIYDGVFNDSAAFTEGSDIRVMSFNILCDLWGNPSVKNRSEDVMRVIKCYLPDAVGLQEVSANWHSAINDSIKSTPYKLICTEHDYVDKKYGNTNFTPILYNADTLTLIECDTEEYTEAKTRYMRTMSYAYFEQKASGKKFVLLNTHYEAPGNNETEKAEHLEYRKAQTADMVNMIDELEERYGCPVLITGDFNTTEGSDKADQHAPYWNLIEQAELQDAKKSADKIKRACKTWHDLGEQVAATNAGSFDHIFGNEKVHFTYFNTLIDKWLMSASDHCPIYADVKLN